ncbi:TolC family protein [Burkholderia sp. 22PA0106]|uniref:TolC family protein n=1 Tax=Burkholderia sp. 22PA0106 TaxID=3237371 RepID=UPI0039C0E9B9
MPRVRPHPVRRPEPHRHARRTLGALAAACLLLTAGCVSYRPQPLARQASFTTTAGLARLTIDPAAMPSPALAAHRFDPSDGFDIDEVAMLAVANNPDLRLARDDLGIAHAQAFAAGLLPDPQISVSSDYPGQVGLGRAFSYGLAMDVMAIVTRGANRKAADAAARKTDLALLWQEWQVVVQAKQLFVKARFQAAMLPLLDAQRELARSRFDQTQRAIARHDTTDDVATAAQLAYADATRQANDMRHAQAQTHHDLNLLLGLAPDVTLTLTGSDTIAPLPDATLDAAVAALPSRRPDLIALEAGYAAQEQKLRAAVLNQFPSLQVGFNRSRDTSEIYSSGFQINFSLPVFNRNRGNIAIETATRQRLADEYATRLNAAYADIAHLRADTALSEAQLVRAEAALPALDAAGQRARSAYATHDITLQQMTDAATAALARRIDAATQQEALAEQRIGLQAMLGATIPDPGTPADSSGSPSIHAPTDTEPPLAAR